MATLTRTEQQYTSKNTSINSTRLPIVYNKVNWNFFRDKILLDVGAGKYTEHIKKFLEPYGIHYVPYDPYNCTAEENLYASSIVPDVIVCSNVFNVIKEQDLIYELYDMITAFDVPFFITVYEGDKSWVGRETRKDCWQRNQEIDAYIFNWQDEVKHGVITRHVHCVY